MNYKILQMALRHQPTVFCEFQLEQKIVDFCFVEGLGFFFIAGHAIGKIELDGKVVYPFLGQTKPCTTQIGFRQRVSFENPISLCYREANKTLLILEKGGRNILSLNTLADFYCQLAFSSDILKQANKHHHAYAIQNSACIRADGHLVAWSLSSIHRAFYLNGTSLKIIGNGRRGYSIANSEEYCQLSNPSGVAIKNSALYIADKDNHCIRRFLQGYHLVIGHPTDAQWSDFLPESPVFIEDALFFIDRYMLKQMLNARAKLTTVYQNQQANGLLLTTMGSKAMAILEMTNA